MKHIGPFVIANMVMGNGETSDQVAASHGHSGGESGDFEAILTKHFGKPRGTEEPREEAPAQLETEKKPKIKHGWIPVAVAMSPLLNQVNQSELGGSSGELEIQGLDSSSVEVPLLSYETSMDASELLSGLQPVSADHLDLGDAELTEANLEVDVPEHSFSPATIDTAVPKLMEKTAVPEQEKSISVDSRQIKGQSVNAEASVNALDSRSVPVRTLADSYYATPEIKGQDELRKLDLQQKDKPVRQIPLEQPSGQAVESDVQIPEQAEEVAMDAEFGQVSLVAEQEQPTQPTAEFLVDESPLDDLTPNGVKHDRAQTIPEDMEIPADPWTTGEESLNLGEPKVVSQSTQSSQTKESFASENEQSTSSLPKTKERSPLEKHTDLVATEFRVQEPKIETPELETPIREVLDLEDRGNLFPKLVKSIESLVTDERSEVRIQLKPDHLGELKIKLSLERGIMVAEFIVQSESVREVIASQLPQLHTALQQQGTQVADVQINIGMGHKEQDHQDQPRSRQFNHGSQNRLAKPSAVGVSKNYLGGSMWNQVDVKV
ncbi:MAG: hypothetical protein GX971_09500 [Firmicutes bacterium]|nr:hypothetical protein [Bacillota bacterium]